MHRIRFLWQENETWMTLLSELDDDDEIVEYEHKERDISFENGVLSVD